MKIKFIRPFRFIGNAPDDGSDDTVPVGYIVDLENDESTQWLIDNGFAEKVEEEWPVHGDKCLYVNSDGTCVNYTWQDDTFDIFSHNLKSIGNVFKTKVSAQRFVNYLKAVETIRHDDGFMKISRRVGYATYGYAISHNDYNKNLVVDRLDSTNHAGQFYFDIYKHAKASLDKHPNEWRTILNYDWSKGEDEEDEE